jgi:dihydroflavonol-4-reductase
MDSVGSADIIRGLLDGKPPAIPRFGFYVVDVRDLADAHVRAMTDPHAAGERFIVAGEFVWMREMAAVLRARLGARAERVPTRGMPDLVVRFLAVFNARLRMLALDLGRKNSLSADKAQRVLGFRPRPVEATLTECAESLLAGVPAYI